MHFRKILLFVLLALLFTMIMEPLSAETGSKKTDEDGQSAFSHLFDSLSRVSLSVETRIGFPVKEASDFYDCGFGAGIRLDYEFSFQFFSFSTTGISSRLFYINNFTSRREISEFYSILITNGIWIRYDLPKDFVLQADCSIGFVISKITATSVDYDIIDDVYYDFLFEPSISLQKVFFTNKQCIFSWKIRPFYTFQYEKTLTHNTVGTDIALVLQLAERRNRK